MGRKYRFFKCVSRKCKGKCQKCVCCYLDSEDHNDTSNLKCHAVKCFSENAIEVAFENTQPQRHDGSIFAVFAHQGQQPIKISHHAHTTEETRWVLVCILNAVTYETLGLILQDGVLKTTAHIELSRTISWKFLWKPGGLKCLFPAQWQSHTISRLHLNVATSALILS
jgi:hypothetical protein